LRLADRGIQPASSTSLCQPCVGMLGVRCFKLRPEMRYLAGGEFLATAASSFSLIQDLVVDQESLAKAPMRVVALELRGTPTNSCSATTVSKRLASLG